jgi:hypothetical protein
MQTYHFHICLYYDVVAGRGRIDSRIAACADKDAFHGAVTFFAVLFQQVKPLRQHRPLSGAQSWRNRLLRKLPRQ